jgi:hypothetical protein
MNKIISIHDSPEDIPGSEAGPVDWSISNPNEWQAVQHNDSFVLNCSANATGVTGPTGVVGHTGWEGFWKESKSYVGYSTRRDKINFWKGLPRAALVFYWLCFKHHVTQVYAIGHVWKKVKNKIYPGYTKLP